MEFMLAEAVRRTLRGYANSVLVAASADAGGRAAMTATAVVPVCLDPPTMLVCVHREAELYPILQRGAGFTLSLLRPGQEEISNACGGAVVGEARFALGDWRTDAGGLPWLADAASAFGCRQVRRVAQGSHDIVIGEVVWVEGGDLVDPLLHVDGAYRSLNPNASR